MKFLCWGIVLTLWCINYYVYLSWNTDDNAKTKSPFVISIILQTISTMILIWLLVPSYYREHSFYYIVLDIPVHIFTFYVGALLITGIMCGIYKAIVHRYMQKVEKNPNLNTLQLRIATDNVDSQTETFFYGHILYIIMIILTVCEYI